MIVVAFTLFGRLVEAGHHDDVLQDTRAERDRFDAIDVRACAAADSSDPGLADPLRADRAGEGVGKDDPS
jgi:hypothetical protein